MPRPVRHTRSARRISRYLAVFVAAAAVFVGAVAPIEAVSATASASVSAPQARLSSDPAQIGIAKASLDGFSAGNIISDAVFTNKNTMTEAQIQSFFNGKVPRCVVGKDENGKPYVCLKDYRISSVNRPADSYCSGYQGAPNETAARIIYKVAQACNINPQVLIVMLQKEQGLVTHVWPSAWRYDSALGQGCPDTAPCDPNFVGFFHQIYGAARQMQIYMEGKWFTWYAPGKTWGIQWHPNASCGRGNVYVANKATSALYYYTPYQPNAAAMRAGYGEGDACSSYGNRNFYNYFTDWFGSTQAPSNPDPPTLSSPNTQQYITGIDKSGALWAYPFDKGKISATVKLATGLSTSTDVVPVGDFDGDGNRDIVLRQGAKVMLMRGNGKGFNSATQLDSNWGNVRLVTAAGDFDEDGVPDVMTAGKGGDLTLWRGNDQGGFRSGVQIGTNWNSISQIVGALDFDRDGHLDLIARDSIGRLWSYFGDGRGGWLRQQQFGQGWNGMTAIFAPGDFDGDGIVDVAGRTSNGDLWMYPGTGNGTVKNGYKIGNGWQNMTGMAGAGAEVRGKRTLPNGVGDVDRDGASDVIALDAKGVLTLYRGDGGGGWRGTKKVKSGFGSGERLFAMGDFNGDGRRDLGRIAANGKFMIYPGRTSGMYGDAVSIGIGWQSFALVTTGIDFDGDRRPDVLARDAAGQMLLYRGDGAGGWAADPMPIGQGWGAFDLAFNVGDFDGDGYADLMVRSSNGALWLYPTKSNGTWGTPSQVGQGWGGFSAVFSPGDFDGDGEPDVLARSASGELYLYRGDGKGGWKRSGIIGWGWSGFTALG